MSALYPDRELLYRSRGIASFRWSAIFAGLAVALGVQVFLMAIGGAIGISAGIPATAFGNHDATARGLGIGAGVWMVLSPIVSMFIGGYVASFLSRPAERGSAALNGVTVWALSLVAGALMIGTAATSTLTGVLNGATAGATNGAAIATADTVNQPRVQREQVKVDAKRAKVDAQHKVDENRPEIQATANDTAKVATGVSFAAVFGMLLSLVGAVFGALMAVPEFFRLDRSRNVGAISMEPERETAHSPIIAPTPHHEETLRDDLH